MSQFAATPTLAALAGLPVADGPWYLDLSLWPPTEVIAKKLLLAHAARAQAWAALGPERPTPLLLQRLEALARAPVHWQACSLEDLEEAHRQASIQYRAMDALQPQASEESLWDEPDISVHALDAEAPPVVQLLNAILHDALQDGASDVHIESGPTGGVVKLRIDGVMLTVKLLEARAVVEQMVSRLKVMAELDIGERRLPQDGRFRLRLPGRLVDFRLSIMPTSHGEDAVVRILDKTRIQMGGTLSLDGLGMAPDVRAEIRRMARLAHGMLLVTGPTGSGKTTTLYATLSEIHTGRDKVITIEDPVEYRLDGIVQIPVNEKKGLTFAKGLRSILRHDPDRIMVGEIRDAETAQIAVQAALTGHLVFSTVHANGVFDVVGRLTHMGLDLYHVVSAINGIVAQRLLRQICQHCIGPDQPSKEDLGRLRVTEDAYQFKRGAGCSKCRGTGYQGRKAYAEVMKLDDDLRDLIASRAPTAQLKRAASQKGMQSLRSAALAGVAAGETTAEEVLRVTLDDE